MNKEELIEMIIIKYGKDDIGCYINGKWFSPYKVLELINEMNDAYEF
jgi:hypothetical protein